ncbi:MAG TPA: NAD(P)/FAD-dependent oxidoreductase [Solirubrobacterales bacterium]|jgi:flavin-dependent dehydrogenase|nr:NAD(P)/FAD-dependent oxidoreductase [Solirubrobacterales bacterium]
MTEIARNDTVSDSQDYDAVIVGASLAGCAAAIQLGRTGARVALVERRLDPAAFKRTCSHFIQASAVPTLTRLSLLEPMIAAGAVRSRMRAWTRWGWIDPPPERAGYAVNLRRERLDPLIRGAAAATPGVEMGLGLAAAGLLRGEDGAVAGVVLRDPDGAEMALRGRLTIGADGRDSGVAELAGVRQRVLPHGRFAYGAYYEGELPEGAPDSSMWMLDPDWASAFPTDGGLVLYGAMPTRDRLPEFRRDPEAALVELVAGLPDAPPIRAARRVGPILGKLEMPNRVRVVTAPGLALIGDAALATDPLSGIGCGWALQSAEWLAEAVAPALRGEETLRRGLARYRRRHRRELRGHASLIHDYASGRRFSRGERMLFAAAARDPEAAAAFDAIGTRRARPGRVLATAMPRALAVNLRHGRPPRAGTVSPRRSLA